MSRGRFYHVAAVAALLISGLTGCTSQLPLVSHAHVGHAMTTWHDTPGEAGLLLVAGQDLRMAERELGLACAVDGGFKRGHMSNALHALLPDAQPQGPGSGYGALRAFAGAVEHLEYAATSADASLNLVTAVAELASVSEPIVARLAATAQLAQASLVGPSGEQRQYCRQIRRELGFALHGTGSDQPEQRGFENIGFFDFVDRLEAALQRESNPSYAPIKRRYLLGLVRLPNGEWKYRLPRQGRSSQAYAFGY